MQQPSKTRSFLLALFVSAGGCAAPAATGPAQGATAAPTEQAVASEQAPAAPPSEPEQAAPGAVPAQVAEASDGGAPPPASAPAAPQEPPPGTPLDARPADPSRSLPEVRVRQVGMHIGGGPNDAESKQPFSKAIEARNQQYLVCYRLVKNPLQGGTFGVDLFVGTAGGMPDVRATRQRLGGSDFESCMVDAVGGVRFARQPKPTTLSYSMRFDVRDPSVKPPESR